MKIGDIVVDVFSKSWIVYQIDGHFTYVTDFKTQKQKQILLPDEITEVIEIPNNVKFMFLNRRDKDVQDIKEYV